MIPLIWHFRSFDQYACCKSVLPLRCHGRSHRFPTSDYSFHCTYDTWCQEAKGTQQEQLKKLLIWSVYCRIYFQQIVFESCCLFILYPSMKRFFYGLDALWFNFLHTLNRVTDWICVASSKLITRNLGTKTVRDSCISWSRTTTLTFCWRSGCDR